MKFRSVLTKHRVHNNFSYETMAMIQMTLCVRQRKNLANFEQIAKHMMADITKIYDLFERKL